MKSLYLSVITCLITSVLAASTVVAASITVIPTGTASYAVQGAAMNGVTGIQLEIGYDRASLALPSVSKGDLTGDAMMAANTNIPGVIKVAIISTRAFSAAGMIAAVSFASHNGTGGITSFSASLIDSAGHLVPVTTDFSAAVGSKKNENKTTPVITWAAPADINYGTALSAVQLNATANVPGTFSYSPESGSVLNVGRQTLSVSFIPSDTETYNNAARSVSINVIADSSTSSNPVSQNTQNTQGSQNTQSTSTTSYLGAVSTPADLQPRTESKPEGTERKATPPAAEISNDSTTPQRQEPAPEKPSEPEKPVEVKQTVYISVLDRFRAYKGEMSPEILTALFSKEISPGIRQEPPIAVCDGKSVIKILFTPQTSEKGAPNFTLGGARMVSLRKEDDSPVWVLEALPQAGSLKATVTVLTNTSVQEFPLTLVPAMSETIAKEVDFTSFIKDTGVKPPKYDLNGDAVHDYQDNFIYIGHYILRKGQKAKPAVQKPLK